MKTLYAQCRVHLVGNRNHGYNIDLWIQYCQQISVLAFKTVAQLLLMHFTLFEQTSGHLKALDTV